MKTHRLVRWGVVILLLVFTLSLVNVPRVGAQQRILIRFGHVGFPDSLFELTAQEFARRVSRELAGRVEVRVFHSSQLGTDEDMIRGVRIGALEMFLPSTIMSSVDDAFGVFEMPYIIVNRRHMKAVAEHADVKKNLLEAQAVKGLRLLATWENGYRHVTNNVRPINKPDDLRGIKLRIPRGVWRQKMFQAYGANPTPMAFAEVFSALQTGVMDGQENPFSQIVSAKFQEVQKYLSITGHVYIPAYVTVGSKKWASLPADVRKVLEDTAKEMQKFVYATAEGEESELLAKIKAAGVQVNEADKSAFVRASAGIHHEFGLEVKGSKELIDKALSLAK